jgi:hypothetical protein
MRRLSLAGKAALIRRIWITLHHLFGNREKMDQLPDQCFI